MLPSPVRKVLLAATALLGVLGSLIVFFGTDARETATAPQRSGDRSPFLQALDDLARARGLRYQDTSTSTAERRDVRVSPSGMLTGTLSAGSKNRPPKAHPPKDAMAADLPQDVLRIDGRTYTRRQPPPGEGNPTGTPPDGRHPDRWTIGAPGDAATLHRLDRFQPPGALAAQLRRALDTLRELPDPNDPKSKPESVGGVPALRADTPAGSLLVSKAKPYRVLRLEPYAPTPSPHSTPHPKHGTPPPAPPKITIGPLKDGDSAGMDLTPLSGGQADAMYATLETVAGRLADAVDGGVAFSLNDAGDLGCGPDGCYVTERFTGTLDPAARDRHADGTVTAVLHATVTIDGRNAGSCTSDRTTFRFGGDSLSGALTCFDVDAGAAFSEAGDTGNTRPRHRPWPSGHRFASGASYRLQATVEAVALSADEVDGLVAQAQRERHDAAGGAPEPGTRRSGRGWMPPACAGDGPDEGCSQVELRQ
ncbi:hypothetical protein [Streptomyces sp. NPDC093707]|uniref:hypothetical protein n=1 Tax=Streptomyces sp. NPDC093707 TaxID=3154984 RepID=UPI00344F370A